MLLTCLIISIFKSPRNPCDFYLSHFHEPTAWITWIHLKMKCQNSAVKNTKLSPRHFDSECVVAHNLHSLSLVYIQNLEMYDLVMTYTIKPITCYVNENRELILLYIT